MDKIFLKLQKSIDSCMNEFESSGALPSPIVEKDYGMLRGLIKYQNELPDTTKAQIDKNARYEQKIMTFMVENYYLPQSRYTLENK